MDASLRFYKYVSPEALTGCWIWSGAYRNDRKKGGCPVFYHDGGPCKASRFIYELEKEPIVDGNYIRHMCHNPACVNPAHLEQGTQKENMYDSLCSGRLNKKLTDEDVLNIRKEYVPFVVSLNMLAAKYKICNKSVLDIIKGRKYKNLLVAA